MTPLKLFVLFDTVKNERVGTYGLRADAVAAADRLTDHQTNDRAGTLVIRDAGDGSARWRFGGPNYNHISTPDGV